MNKVLRILEENARYTNEEIAMMTGKTAVEVAEEIDRLEKDGVIRGYKAIVDRDRLSDEMPNMVSAIIELRVTPKRDAGFDEIAEKIAQYSEVEDAQTNYQDAQMDALDALASYNEQLYDFDR